MQNASTRMALTIRLPKTARSRRPLTVSCVLGHDVSINDFEVDLLDAILRAGTSSGGGPDPACNDNAPSALSPSYAHGRSSGEDGATW